jgi:hypothetical protein
MVICKVCTGICKAKIRKHPNNMAGTVPPFTGCRTRDSRIFQASYRKIRLFSSCLTIIGTWHLVSLYMLSSGNMPRGSKMIQEASFSVVQAQDTVIARYNAKSIRKPDHHQFQLWWFKLTMKPPWRSCCRMTNSMRRSLDLNGSGRAGKAFVWAQRCSISWIEYDLLWKEILQQLVPIVDYETR